MTPWWAMTSPSSEGPLQFGRRKSGLAYADRPAAFGVLVHEGMVALVHVVRENEDFHDLPGGALEGAETELEALVREFGEETGLRVAPAELLARGGQYMIRPHNEPVNNLSAIHHVTLVSEEPALKIEPTHTLVWASPDAAVRMLRHDSHAFALICWMRRGH